MRSLPLTNEGTLRGDARACWFEDKAVEGQAIDARSAAGACLPKSRLPISLCVRPNWANAQDLSNNRSQTKPTKDRLTDRPCRRKGRYVKEPCGPCRSPVQTRHNAATRQPPPPPLCLPRSGRARDAPNMPKFLDSMKLKSPNRPMGTLGSRPSTAAASHRPIEGATQLSSRRK